MKHKLPIFGFALAVVVIAVDQISKWRLLDYFQHSTAKSPPSVAVTDFFNLVLVWNRGVSFGMFNNAAAMPIILVALALLLVAFVAHWLLRTETPLEAAAFGLIIGGAIGNVIDRLHHGAVVDFLDFHLAAQHWPAFNVADSAIVIGAGLILYLWGLHGKTGA